MPQHGELVQEGKDRENIRAWHTREISPRSTTAEHAGTHTTRESVSHVVCRSKCRVDVHVQVSHMTLCFGRSTPHSVGPEHHLAAW
jgi:hypothetical protein